MGLFTSPVTFTVNTVARIFNFRAQLPDSKSVVGEWIEPAAAISAASKFTIKHDDSSKTIERGLIKYTCNKVIADGVTLKPITVNFTVIRHAEHTAAQVDEAMEMMSVATSSDTTRANFVQKLI